MRIKSQDIRARIQDKKIDACQFSGKLRFKLSNFVSINLTSYQQFS